jgi:hypothetical protein
MSTIAVFNGFGKYEQTQDGQKGITLKFGGVPFWLPYDKITYFPDYTMREVDQDKSSPGGQVQGELVYHTFRVSGDTIVDILLENGDTHKNSDKGIIVIPSEGHRKDSYIKVSSGYEIDGRPIFESIQEIVPTALEIQEAHRLADIYKQTVVQEYLQSKRERINGGVGQTTPSGLTRVYMDELGIKDLDDVSKSLEQSGANGLTLEILQEAVKALQALNPKPQTTVPEPTKSGPPGKATGLKEVQPSIV